MSIPSTCPSSLKVECVPRGSYDHISTSSSPTRICVLICTFTVCSDKYHQEARLPPRGPLGGHVKSHSSWLQDRNGIQRPWQESACRICILTSNPLGGPWESVNTIPGLSNHIEESAVGSRVGVVVCHSACDEGGFRSHLSFEITHTCPSR